MANRVECDGLTVTYGAHVAADDITFEVAEGEIFGLLGPNGAGKTSVIRALTTIIAPASGTASVAGASLGDQQAIRRSIGVLPESSGYPRSQTGRSYLEFYGQLFGVDRREARRRAERLLDQLGLAGTDQPISEYSRGMRQRLGLCRALVNEPVVLFLDEPTLGLDPAGKEEIVRYLAEVSIHRGTTVILCTHLLDEVERVCDRVAIMDESRLVTQGTVAEVIGAADLAASASLVLDPADVPMAMALIEAMPAVERVVDDPTQPGQLGIHLVPGFASGSNDVLGAVVAAGLPVRSFAGQQVSLNEAFLSLTGSPVA